MSFKYSLTQYYKQSICPICKCSIKGHARSQCSNCHRIVCQSHMIPYLGPNKMCPDCYKNQKNFISQQGIINKAETLYKNQKIKEAKQLTEHIFAQIFNKNIITAQETEENIPLEEPSLKIEENNETEPSVETRPTNIKPTTIETKPIEKLISSIMKELHDSGVTPEILLTPEGKNLFIKKINNIFNSTSS